MWTDDEKIRDLMVETFHSAFNVGGTPELKKVFDAINAVPSVQYVAAVQWAMNVLAAHGLEVTLPAESQP